MTLNIQTNTPVLNVATQESILTLQEQTTTLSIATAGATQGGVEQIIAGNNITISPSTGVGAVTINATAGSSGTVTSVALSGGTTGLTVTGSPITTSGTLTLGGTLAVASGGTGTTNPSLVAGNSISITGTWPNQTVAFSGAAGGVTQLVAGTNISLSPAGGTGVVTVNATANNGTSWTSPSNIQIGDIFCGFSQTTTPAGSTLTTTGLATTPNYWDVGAFLTSSLTANSYSSLPFNIDWQVVAGNNKLLLRVGDDPAVYLTTDGNTVAAFPGSNIYYSLCYHAPYGFVGAINGSNIFLLANNSSTPTQISTGLTGNGIDYATLGSNGVNCVAITSAFGNTAGQVFTSPTPQTSGTWTQRANAPVLASYSRIVSGQDGVLMAVALPYTFNANGTPASTSSQTVTSTAGGATTSVTFTHASRTSALVGSKIQVSGFTPSTYNINNVTVTASTATTTTVTYPTAPGATVTTQGRIRFGPILIRSTDAGETFTVVNNIDTGFSSYAKGGFGLATNGTGTWVSVGSVAGGGGNIYSTNNGITWLESYLPPACHDVTYANGYFVAVSRNSTLPPYFSTNGQDWTRGTFNPEISYSCAVGGINGQFVSVGNNTLTCNATNNIFVENQEASVPLGTYRNLGALGHNTNLAFWTRTA